MSSTRSKAILQLGAEITQSLAEIAVEVAQLAPVPGLGPAATLVLTIINLSNSVSVNKREAELLARRCASLLPMLQDGTQGMKPDMVTEHVGVVCVVLQKVQYNFEIWSKWDIFDRVLNRNEVSATIRANNTEIDQVLQSLLTAAAIQSARWQQEAEKAREADTHSILSEIHLLNEKVSTQSQLDRIARQNSMDSIKLVEFMGLVQDRLQDRDAPDGETSALQQILATMLDGTGKFPPGVRLAGNGKEVKRTKQFPNKIGYHYDVYEGVYLGQKKVALKVMRGIRSDEEQVNYFVRECQLWRDVGERDGGRHIVPLIGVVTDDGPYPYMVSPWQDNGSAITWVKQMGDRIDVKKLIRSIAYAILVLHTWEEGGIVHGDIRGDNILIDINGNPLITDFSLAKTLDKLPGVPKTHSVGLTESYRWTAPEVSNENPVMSFKSDIFSFGMTMLELITAQQPFAEVRHNTTVLFKIQKGQRPMRPTTKTVGDGAWALMQGCWAHNPEERPSIQEVIAALDAMA